MTPQATCPGVKGTVVSGLQRTLKQIEEEVFIPQDRALFLPSKPWRAGAEWSAIMAQSVAAIDSAIKALRAANTASRDVLGDDGGV